MKEEVNWMARINEPAVMCRDFFIQRAIEALDYYDKIKHLRGEGDGLTQLILKTAELNKELADKFLQ